MPDITPARRPVRYMLPIMLLEEDYATASPDYATTCLLPRKNLHPAWLLKSQKMTEFLPALEIMA